MLLKFIWNMLYHCCINSYPLTQCNISEDRLVSSGLILVRFALECPPSPYTIWKKRPAENSLAHAHIFLAHSTSYVIPDENES
jgi:hypothetical protein